MFHTVSFGRLAAAIVVLSFPIGASVVNFESFLDGDLLTNQIPGITFTNTTIYSSGISLNEFEFPPRSGTNVASDFGGPITISFDVSLSAFSAYFTYLGPLTVTAFNASHIQLGSVTSLFASNLGISGDPGSSPNELLQFSGTGIRSVTITGQIGGGSFTMDDLGFTPGTTTATPEPRTALLTATLLACAAAIQRNATR